MQWLLLGALTYVAGYLLLGLYTLAKPRLAGRMPTFLIAPALSVTRSVWPMIAPRHPRPVDRASILRRLDVRRVDTQRPSEA